MEFDSEVRVSWQHRHISEAITRVVAEDTPRAAYRALQIVWGPDAHVRSCDDYADSLCHLTDEAYCAFGQTTGAFYAGW